MLCPNQTDSQEIRSLVIYRAPFGRPCPGGRDSVSGRSVLGGTPNQIRSVCIDQGYAEYGGGCPSLQYYCPALSGALDGGPRVACQI